ncbi:hypothetical protein BpHYR1_000448 [Brachionus plicatilis]|uniref:Uncharacterized protein n=1 Tax=Brachionus plicatilis TaxID=10195 RepID=A0A3M7RMK8_BRAPC|nr:hypothetical protein BpHYR1_000448 [Brachionus plicatilis]
MHYGEIGDYNHWENLINYIEKKKSHILENKRVGKSLLKVSFRRVSKTSKNCNNMLIPNTFEIKNFKLNPKKHQFINRLKINRLNFIFLYELCKKMASRSFLDYSDRCKHSEFSFEYFRTEILPMITPKKLRLNPNAEQKSLEDELKNAIISNLGLNPYFYKFDFRHEQNQFVQLIFLLHLSKANIDDKGSWNNFFLALQSIKIIDTNESILKKELDEFMHQLKKCNKFTDKILAVGQEMSGIENIVANFEDLKINFISSSIPGLNGFSGINSIYINLTELLRKHNVLTNSVYEDKAQILVKFECLRLFVHESCHVLIRQSLNDLN